MTSEIGVWSAVRAAALRVAAWPLHVAAARATMRALANMDHRELADIGLTRSDLRDASALALDCDPTALFSQRARERRRAAPGGPTPHGGAPLDGAGFRPKRKGPPSPAGNGIGETAAC